eukprot:350064-Chlamydomonas_euryale.AAC.1
MRSCEAACVDMWMRGISFGLVQRPALSLGPTAVSRPSRSANRSLLLHAAHVAEAAPCHRGARRPQQPHAADISHRAAGVTSF